MKSFRIFLILFSVFVGLSLCAAAIAPLPVAAESAVSVEGTMILNGFVGAEDSWGDVFTTTSNATIGVVIHNTYEEPVQVRVRIPMSISDFNTIDNRTFTHEGESLEGTWSYQGDEWVWTGTLPCHEDSQWNCEYGYDLVEVDVQAYADTVHDFHISVEVIGDYTYVSEQLMLVVQSPPPPPWETPEHLNMTPKYLVYGSGTVTQTHTGVNFVQELLGPDDWQVCYYQSGLIAERTCVPALGVTETTMKSVVPDLEAGGWLVALSYWEPWFGYWEMLPYPHMWLEIKDLGLGYGVNSNEGTQD